MVIDDVVDEGNSVKTTPNSSKIARNKEEREAEKERKATEKLRREQEREQQRQQREAEKMAKDAEKQALRQQREMERAAKHAEQQKREEERRLKREAKLAEKAEKEAVKEAEKREKEELERKKANSQKRIMSFFQPTPVKRHYHWIVTLVHMSRTDFERFFPPFCVKSDMTLARVVRSASLELELTLETLPQNKLSLPEMKRSLALFTKEERNRTRTVKKLFLALNTTDMTVSNGIGPMKLLQYAEDVVLVILVSTWSRKSRVITGRRFLARDDTLLNYEVDSEAEWEEEGEGEECRSDEEDDDDDEQDTLVNRKSFSSQQLEEEDDEDGWLVPHGYLSEDEGESDDDKQVSSETKQATHLPMPKRVQPLVPMIIGPTFTREHNTIIPVELTRLQLVPLTPNCQPIDPWSDTCIFGYDGELIDMETTRKRKASQHHTKKVLLDEQLPQLVKHIHGVAQSMANLLEQLKDKFPQVSKRQLDEKIRDIATKVKSPCSSKMVWQVRQSVIDELGLVMPPFDQVVASHDEPTSRQHPYRHHRHHAI
ncbi:hypothetical protein BDF22DRAFT_741956 [Syncephalis plumigaleata]|nr:hypothetical protein BDF22DRAFT_741956 [Syncephalis plumigaleata]